MSKSSTVIFWGAGATVALGMRTTDKQGAFISKLAGADEKNRPTPLPKRIRDALGGNDAPCWRHALSDLITILGDGEDSNLRIDVIQQQHLKAMARHWQPGATADDLSKHILALRLIYDWPALKNIVRICPGIQSARFQINDLFNIMDMHAPLGHGFRADEGRFLDAQRLIGAKNALKMLLHAMFYIDYQLCLQKHLATLRQYYGFAVALGKRMQRAGQGFSNGFDRPEFIRDDINFVSLNYDPTSLWAQFVANRDLNHSPSVPHVGSPAIRLQIFHDMGHFIPSRRIEPRSRPALWYPMNEASAQRINEDDMRATQRIRLSKFLFPHGCLCWRECPDCGKLSAYHGDEWDIASSSLIPPPPLKGFVARAAYPNLALLNHSDSLWREHEKNEWEKGRVDVRACLHCGTLTSMQHTQTIMQSSFKQAPPSFIDEIQRDLRALVMQANHIVFMGYSLPPDDVSYRSFFAARCQRARDDDDGSKVHCTIVNYDQKNPNWIGPEELEAERFEEKSLARGVVSSAIEIFGKGNVRFYGGGVPKVFLDNNGTVSEQLLAELVTWPSA